MIPIVQTKVVVKNSQGEMIVRGNCYAAAIASILERPVTEVPNVESAFHVDDTFWSIVMQTFLKSIGYELIVNDQYKVFHDNDFDADCRSNYLDKCRDKFYLVSGMSPRGVMHMCVYKNGQLVHDPHPTKDGLLTEDIFEEIINS